MQLFFFFNWEFFYGRKKLKIKFEKKQTEKNTATQITSDKG